MTKEQRGLAWHLDVSYGMLPSPPLAFPGVTLALPQLRGQRRDIHAYARLMKTSLCC